MIWIIDASVALRWFLKNEVHPNAEAVLFRLLENPHLFAVPELFTFEVYAVLCRLHPQGSNVYLKGVIPLINSGIFRQPMTENIVRQSYPFTEKGLSGYDACYAALAKELQGTWLTFDEKAHRCIAEDQISHVLTDSLPSNWI